MLAIIKEKASTVTTRELKDMFLNKLEPISPEAYTYCKGLFKHQEAQQIFVRLRDKQDREEVISKLLAPARQQYQQAEQRLHYFINNEQPPLNFESNEFKAWKEKREALQKEAEECRRRCDVEQNVGGVLDTVKSLKDLDDHSETYRLFATSLHYGYFVILALFWILYSIYYFGLYLFDRIPAQRRDLNKIHQKLDGEISEMGKKIVEMENNMMLLMMKQATEMEKMNVSLLSAEGEKRKKPNVVVEEFSDERTKEREKEKEKEQRKIIPDSEQKQVEDEEKENRNNDKKENYSIATLFEVGFKNFPLSAAWQQFLNETNPFTVVMYSLMMLMMFMMMGVQSNAVKRR